VARLAAAARSPAGLAGRLTAQLGGQCVQVPPRLGRVPLVTADLLNVAHRRGLVVHVWTVNRRSEMTDLLDLGVDGIITDEAETLRDVLRERRAWS
jgi:glycerophosphoryl diester phosphodiesterase